MTTQTRALTWDYVCELQREKVELQVALEKTLAWAQANLPQRSDLHKSFPFFEVGRALAKTDAHS